jgi:hypothetical protein
MSVSAVPRQRVQARRRSVRFPVALADSFRDPSQVVAGTGSPAEYTDLRGLVVSERRGRAARPTDNQRQETAPTGDLER